ncbi:ribokinase [Neobacillus sp. NPDC093127]|uniref:ribokinase n=1 Tax=Neobacillus sp. NPDC093127 TaxID=3364296 RepID=UPI003811EF21
MNRKPSVLVIGSINMDLVLKVDKVPVDGETVLGESYAYIPGGKGANQGVAAARLGADVTFIGRVGEDANGKVLKGNLQKEGINAEFVIESPETSTGIAAIMLQETGQNRIIVIPGANMKITKEDLQTAFEHTYDAVIVQLEIPDEIVIEASRLSKEKNIPVILDAGPAKSFPLEDLEGLEIVSPNESEALALTGVEVNSIESAEKAAIVLKERSNAKTIVLKMGSLGAYLYEDGEGEFFPAHKVKVVDTTAAGDAFTAALTVKYMTSKDIKEAIRFANVAGAITVTRMGAQPSLPTVNEVEKFAARL